VLDGRLRDREWVAGAYSIADIMNYPWFAALAERQPDALEGAEAAHVRRWIVAMAARPAVQKGMDVGSQLVSQPRTPARPA
jgi:GSH-dependent disulfide-bond oxidoreductase